MGLICDVDDESYYVDIIGIVEPTNTHICIECGCLIHHGIEHYIVREFNYDDKCDERDIGQHRACEECGDLALSIIEQGFCWTYLQLRDDIREINDYG